MSTKPTPITSHDVECAIKSRQFTLMPDGCTTVCRLVMDNGYPVVGVHSFGSADVYDQEIGEASAYARAKRDCFPLLQFRQADKRTGINLCV